MVLFLAALLVCALAPFNSWPFSNWELFSGLRTDRQTGWEAVAVNESGQAHDYPIASSRRGYRGFVSTMADFPRRSAADRNAICGAWLRRADTQFGPDTQLVRLYRLEWLLSARWGDRAAAPHLRLAWICSAKGADAQS